MVGCLAREAISLEAFAIVFAINAKCCPRRRVENSSRRQHSGHRHQTTATRQAPHDDDTRPLSQASHTHDAPPHSTDSTLHISPRTPLADTWITAAKYNTQNTSANHPQCECLNHLPPRHHNTRHAHTQHTLVTKSSHREDSHRRLSHKERRERITALLVRLARRRIIIIISLVSSAS